MKWPHRAAKPKNINENEEKPTDARKDFPSENPSTPAKMIATPKAQKARKQTSIERNTIGFSKRLNWTPIMMASISPIATPFSHNVKFSGSF